MFTHIRNLYGALGVALFLIAMYLVLERASQTSTVIKAAGGTTNDIFRTLQGR
jgi:hypothetical protein